MKRGGKRKQTEEVTETWGVKAWVWERDRIFDWLFQSVLLERVSFFAAVFTVLGICLAAFSFLPVSWPLNSSWWITLPAVCSPNWSQDADALAVSEQYSIYKNAVFLKLNQPGGRLHWGKLVLDKRWKKIVFECFCYCILSGFFSVKVYVMQKSPNTHVYCIHCVCRKSQLASVYKPEIDFCCVHHALKS